MGREKVKLKDTVTLRLYSKDGKLKQIIRKRKSRSDRILKFLMGISKKLR